MLACDTSLPSDVDSAEVYFVGTPESRYFRRYRDILPVRFRGDTVVIGDSMLSAPDFIYQCQFPTLQGHSVEMTIARSPRNAAGEIHFFGQDFVLSRARDGALSRQDLAAFGRLEWYDKRLNTLGLTWNLIPARDLDSIADTNVRLCYEAGFLTRDEAQVIFRLAALEYETFSLLYGLRMPKPVTIYVVAGGAPDGRRFEHTSRSSTVWLHCADRAALLDTLDSPVFGLAYELAGIAFTPLTDEYPFTRRAADWAQYASLCKAVPRAARILGRGAWLVPVDYARIGNRRFEETYRNYRNTYAWMLREIETKYSDRLTAYALLRVLKDRSVPVADMRSFMTVLAGLTADEGIIKRTANAFPTPLDPAFLRARNWQSAGMKPDLGEMFLKGGFTVQTVEPGSRADMAGLRPGDQIVKVDDYSPVKDPAECLRGLLRKSVDQDVVLRVQRKREQKTVTLPAQ